MTVRETVGADTGVELDHGEIEEAVKGAVKEAVKAAVLDIVADSVIGCHK
jgi:hypothetical protein